MKLLKAEVHNFGSYKHLQFDFENQGLTLIHGATGSGKSTLQDIAMWVLYGITSKDGNADDIRSWTNLDEPTEGILQIELLTEDITIHRTRGKGQNDLYWTDLEDLTEHRGKDLTETQKLLEQHLGIDADLYRTAACYNEFSPTTTFFTDKAKDRRELFEKISSLDLPVRIAETTANDRKVTKKALEDQERQHARLSGQQEQQQGNKEYLEAMVIRWEKTKAHVLNVLVTKSQSFERDKLFELKNLVDQNTIWEEKKKSNIETLQLRLVSMKEDLKSLGEERCPTCGQDNEEVLSLDQDITDIKYRIERQRTETNPYISQLEYAYILENKYLEQIEMKKAEINPFLAQIDRLCQECNTLEQEIVISQSKLNELTNRTISLTQLYELSFELRGLLLTNAIKSIETETNRYLEKYFDSEIRVQFQLDADNLKVSIWKSGHECVYKQLSKGQRSLLRLCFAVSIMEASANRAGVHFDTLFFDEALDGLDTTLKLKAFNLFSELSTRYGSILVIDHSEELKSLFSKSYHVTMAEDVSLIEEM